MLTKLRHVVGQSLRSARETWRRELAMSGREQLVAANALGQFKFRCANRIEVGRTAYYGGEVVSLATLLFLLRSDDVVWDIGASVGLFTVHCAARVSQVVAFEPDPATCERLQQNVTLNGMAAKTIVRQAALGAEPGQLELHTDGLDGAAPSLAGLGRHLKVVRVPVETVDALVAGDLPRPTVLKVDIEGAEILALRGARQTLHSPAAPRLLFVELHPAFLPSYGATSDEVTTLIRAAGYRVLSTQPREDQFHIVAVK